MNSKEITKRHNKNWLTIADFGQSVEIATTTTYKHAGV